MKKIQEEVSFIEGFCDELKAEFPTFGENLYIEYGPGLAFDYFGSENFTENYTDLEAFSDCIKNSKYEYVVEMGRFVASPCGEYFTKICDLKSSGGVNYIILDGGINHINYYGQIMAMKVPPLELIHGDTGDSPATTDPTTNSAEGGDTANSNAKTTFCLCGSLCTTADIITKNVELENPKVGDVIVFKNIGAYSITEGIYLFLSHDLPAVYGKNGDDMVELRSCSPIFNLNC